MKVELVSFIYDNTDNSGQHELRFLCVNRKDARYYEGFDLTKRGIRKFRREKMLTNVTSHGSFDESVLQGSKMIGKADVFKMLGWNSQQIAVFTDLGGDANQLAKTVFTKCGRNVFALDSNNFILLGHPEVKLTIDNGSAKMTLRVREGSVEYYDGKKKISTREFTKRMLGL